MNETKTWYQSKTVWGGLIAILGAIGSRMGYDLDAGDASDLADAAVAVVTAAGGVLAILGRITAQKRVE